MAMHQATARQTDMKAPLTDRQRKIPIALRFDPTLLATIDAIAARRGMSRNAIISYWCSKGIDNE